MIDLAAEWADPTPPPPGWNVKAACAGMGPELFYDARGAATAVAVCEACPTRRECLAAVFFEERTIELSAVLGVRGGATEHERRLFFKTHEDRRELRRDHIAECGTDGGYHRHRNLGETTCAECRAAHTAVARLRNPPQPIAPAWCQNDLRKTVSFTDTPRLRAAS